MEIIAFRSDMQQSVGDFLRNVFQLWVYHIRQWIDMLIVQM